MGLYSVIGMLISAMIGSALFSLSSISISSSGGYSIFSWMMAGVIMLLYAIVTCQLSLRYPRSGGLYHFPRLAFSHRPVLASFLALTSAIGTVLCNIIAISFSALLVSNFLPFAADNRIIGFLVISLCLALNLLKLSMRNRVNMAFAVILISMIVCYCVKSFSTAAFSHQRLLSSFSTTGVLSAFGKTFSSIPLASLGYGAVVSACFVAGDVKNPRRNLTLGVIISTFIVIALYCGFIFCTIGVAGADASPTTMLNIAISNLYKPEIQMIFSLVVVVALLSTVNVMMNISAYTLVSVSEGGFLPKNFSELSKKGCPSASLLLIWGLSVLLLMDNFAFRLISLGALFSIFTIVVNISSFLMSFARSKGNRGYKFCAYISLALLALSSVFSIAGDLTLIPILSVFTLSSLIFILLLFFWNIDRRALSQTSGLLPYTISGEVKHGNALGRLVGMPTANIYPQPQELDLLRSYMGVFASYVFLDGKKYRAVTNIGTRPSVDNDSRIVVESHILDGFDKDIYSENIDVCIVEFLRPVLKMDSLAKVKEQVDEDKKRAMKILEDVCV